MNRLFFKNMQLGSAGNVVPNTLRGFVRFHSKTNSTKFIDADIDALLNLHYHEFANEIQKSGSSIDFNMVTEEIDTVKDAATISITGKVLRIKRMEIKWLSGGTTYKITFFDIAERSNPLDTTSIAADFSQTNPFGDLYLAAGEILKVDIFPIPNASVTNGFKVWKVLEITELSGEGDEPSIPEAYQRYLCWGAIRDYFLKKEMFAKATEAEKEMFKLMERAMQFYASRNEEEKYILSDGYSDNYGS